MDKIHIGGQAVIEGVMMRAPRSVAIAVRRPDGEIVVKKELVIPLSERFPIVKLPIVRGAVALFTSLIIGIKALNFSANEAMTEDEKEKEQKKEGGKGGGSAHRSWKRNCAPCCGLPITGRCGSCSRWWAASTSGARPAT